MATSPQKASKTPGYHSLVGCICCRVGLWIECYKWVSEHPTLGWKETGRGRLEDGGQGLGNFQATSSETQVWLSEILWHSPGIAQRRQRQAMERPA